MNTDSLTLYLSFCQNSQMAGKKDKLTHLKELIECVVKESQPFDRTLRDSSLIREIMNMIQVATQENNLGQSDIRISSFDAFVITAELLNYVSSGKYIAIQEAILQKNIIYLFCGRHVSEDLPIVFENMQAWLEKSDKILQRFVADAVQNTVEENSTRLTFKIPSEVNDQDIRILSANEINEAIQKRFETNKRNIEQWHKDNAEVCEALLKLQPSLGELYEKVMNFSTQLTENYILQFAKMQIDLFNLIFDNYIYHKSAVLKTQNDDYRNAVFNYVEFLDAIVDNLAAFGVETINSNVGTGFAGSIHEVVNSKTFSPLTAKVLNSERIGFKYGDIILQKEKISV